jgi:hypothetical protein
MSGDVQTRQRRKEKKKQKRGKYEFIKIIVDKKKNFVENEEKFLQESL